MQEQFKKHQENLKYLDSYVDEFAQQLGVSSTSIKKYAGYIPSDQSWVFAERDEKGKIIGLNKRTKDHKKIMTKGSKRGLIYEPNNFTKMVYKPGKENWIRTTTEIPCPLCGKAGECLLSAYNPQNPSAILCPHTSKGAMESRSTGYLHIYDKKQYSQTITPILVVEGPSDVLAANTMGFMAVGKPSAQGGLQFLEKLLSGQKVIVIGENDEAGRTGMEATFNTLKKVCRSVIKVLPPERFKDLREWMPTKEEFEKWIDEYGNREQNTDILDDISPITLAEKWLQETQYDGKILTLRRHRQIWFKYINGIYKELEDDIIIQQLYNFYVNRQYCKENSKGSKIIVPFIIDKHLIEKIQHALIKTCLIKNGKNSIEPFYIINGKYPPESLDLRKVIIFQNGIFNIETEKLEPLTPDLFTTSIVPYDYNPFAQCDLWKTTLLNMFNRRADSIHLLRQWFGYNLIASNNMEKIMIFVGPPASGKSTITDMLETMLGPTKRTAFNIEDFDNQFGMESLIGKHSVILAEAHLSNKIDGTKILQKINRMSGQDTIKINRKYKESLSTKLYCRITYVCNNLPKFRDDPQTLRRRTNILYFPNSYEKNPDITLKERLLEEIPGIAVWALGGLKDLYKRSCFVIPHTSEKCFEELKLLTCPMAGMIEECCEITNNSYHYVNTDQMYDLHKRWYEENGYYSLTRCQFGRTLSNVCPNMKKIRPNIQGKRIWCYSGIKIRPEAFERYLEKPR